MNDLAILSEAKMAVLKAKTVVEINRIVKVAEAVQAVADTEETKNAADELYFRARRRRGEIVEALPKNEGAKGNPGGRGAKLVQSEIETAQPTLAAQGIDKREASVDYKLNRIPEERFEEFLADKENRSMSTAIKISKGDPHVSHNSGENEWYTPAEFISIARAVMGSIDCDPSSSAIANKTVMAKKYLTKEQDGLSEKWGKSVWMNPPYAQPLINSFCEKLIEKIKAGEVETAMVLVNNATETTWFQLLAENANAIYFIKARVRFLNPDGNPGAPLQGQCLLYFGNNISSFRKNCAGIVYVR